MQILKFREVWGKVYIGRQVWMIKKRLKYLAIFDGKLTVSVITLEWKRHSYGSKIHRFSINQRIQIHKSKESGQRKETEVA